MGEEEKFSIRKFFDFGPIAWATVFGLGLKAFIVVLLILGAIYVKNIFFPKPATNINQPEIHVKEGGTVHYQVIQQSEKKRPWWIPTPFVEIFGELKTDDKRPELGTRFGGRWEF